MCVFAYVTAAARGGSEADAVGVFSALLATATVTGVSQASNRERQRRELARLSRSDPLTGCLNRRGFTARFGQVIAGSLGLASLPVDGETAEALHHSADADLYRSKQQRTVAPVG